tara:strand:+ start:1222 stop:2163 length:942 start_codon:yes stop_codon:yes gene_type:complete
MKGGIVTICNKNREEYLKPYLSKTISYLENNLGEIGKDYEMIISEQTDYKNLYNLNMSLNIGFIYAFETLGCDYAVLVGPDNIPLKNIDYDWKGYNEINFMMYGGFKLDKESFYKSMGANIFMFNWGWHDVEFYGRLETYNISTQKWYITKRAISSEMIDISMERTTENESIGKWRQGRKNISIHDVPKVYTRHWMNHTIKGKKEMKDWLNIKKYSDDGWMENIYTDNLIELTKAVGSIEPYYRKTYYEKTGYKHINMKEVKENKIINPISGLYNIHNPQFNSLKSYQSPSRRHCLNLGCINEYQKIDNGTTM